MQKIADITEYYLHILFFFTKLMFFQFGAMKFPLVH